MPTPQQIEANRQNSLSSTGPKTDAGRQRSALNSTRHGFTGQTVVLTNEEAEPYRLFTEGFLKDLAPVGTQETQLTHSIMDARWRLNQIAAVESAIYALGMRLHAAQFKDETPELANALARAFTFRESRKELDRLHRYESRLYRQATRDQAALTALQSERKARQAAQEKEAIQLLAHFNKLGQTWNPADFGFVLSIEEIESLTVRNLDRAAASRASSSPSAL
jgi:hypothetical protein